MNYTTNGSTGHDIYWYLTSEMISVTAAPMRNSNADPDLYLAFLDSSGWYSQLSSSTWADRTDQVGGLNSSCFSQRWQVRVHAYNGGWFTTRAATMRTY